MAEMNYVLIPINPSLYSALVRVAEEYEVDNPHDYIEDLLGNALNDEEAGKHYWNVMERQRERDERRERCGSPELGYQWKSVFLPNGTKIRMTYSGADTYAEIRHEKFCWGDEQVSPSQFARRVAGNTNRNAWRDLHVLRPDKILWVLADTLRRERR